MNKSTSIIGILLVCCGSFAHAQTSFPMLGSAYPVCIQRGKTTEVTVTAAGNGGTNLYGAYKALFEGEGITAELVPPDKGWPARDPKTPFAVPGIDSVRMKVTAAPNAQLGVHEFRLGTPHHGISSVGQIVISDDPQMLEVEPNNDIQHAQAVALPVAVNGKFQASEDVDCYKFKAAAGQEVVFTAICSRLQDKIHDLQEHADPMLVLTDTSGNELDRNDDYYHADPLLHHKFEKAGEYVIQIRDVSYHGNSSWVYALTITSAPYVTACVPCAVQPGKSNELHLTGYNLAPNETVALDVPKSLTAGVWTISLKCASGLSNPVSLLVSDLNQLVVSPKNDSHECPKTVTAASTGNVKLPALGALSLPGAVNGTLLHDGLADRYNFHSKASELWSFEVTARRLNSEIDSEIKIINSKGAVLVSNDDTFGKDSRIDSWKAPEAGDYFLEIRDISGHSGPNFFYNLRADRIVQDFRLKCDTDRVMIAPGNHTALFMQLERKNGFVGPVKIVVEGLPTGVTSSPLSIPSDATQGVVVLSADIGAKMDSSKFEVTGTALLVMEDGKTGELSRTAHPLTEIYQPGGGRGMMEVNTEACSITDANDLEVLVTAQTLSLKPGGTVKIEVNLKRRPDYTKPVTLDVMVQHLGQVFSNPLPQGVSIDDGASKTLLGDNETKGYITLKAAKDAKPIQNWPIAVLANASINFVMKVWYSAPVVMLTVAP